MKLFIFFIFLGLIAVGYPLYAIFKAGKNKKTVPQPSPEVFIVNNEEEARLKVAKLIMERGDDVVCGSIKHLDDGTVQVTVND